VTAVLFSSCLKQSIPDAMLAVQDPGGQGSATATLSYEINGNAVKISVIDADNQDSNSYTLGCTKSYGSYTLDGVASSGEITFSFYTDSLAVGNYKYTSFYGPMYFLTYNGTPDYVYNASDSLSFNITSYKNGLIGGNFSGLLTPLIDPNNNIYGAPGSVLITKGSFQNVPVFY
jgi:hypothetical protein